MPNSDPLRARIEALRGRSSASVQGGAKTEIPAPQTSIPTKKPVSTQNPQHPPLQGGLDRSRLDALRGRANPAQTQTPQHNNSQQGFATQKELEEGLPTPLLDAFLEEIIVKIQSRN